MAPKLSCYASLDLPMGYPPFTQELYYNIPGIYLTMTLSESLPICILKLAGYDREFDFLGR